MNSSPPPSSLVSLSDSCNVFSFTCEWNRSTNIPESRIQRRYQTYHCLTNPSQKSVGKSTPLIHGKNRRISFGFSRMANTSYSTYMQYIRVADQLGLQ